MDIVATNYDMLLDSINYNLNKDSINCAKNVSFLLRYFTRNNRHEP